MSDLAVDTIFSCYGQQIAAVGGSPVLLPRELDPIAAAELVDAVLLCGGRDIDPRLYQAELTPAIGELDIEQDHFDLELAIAAIAREIPVLGCCRGHQVINVALGGTLIEDLPSVGIADHNIREYPPHRRRHAVSCEEGSLLHEIYGDEISVNSFHHQAVDRLGGDLQASGRAGDGIIEAVELPGRPVLGVQWHPELHENDDPVFSWLIEAASRYSRT